MPQTVNFQPPPVPLAVAKRLDAYAGLQIHGPVQGGVTPPQIADGTLGWRPGPPPPLRPAAPDDGHPDSLDGPGSGTEGTGGTVVAATSHTAGEPTYHELWDAPDQTLFDVRCWLEFKFLNPGTWDTTIQELSNPAPGPEERFAAISCRYFRPKVPTGPFMSDPELHGLFAVAAAFKVTVVQGPARALAGRMLRLKQSSSDQPIYLEVWLLYPGYLAPGPGSAVILTPLDRLGLSLSTFMQPEPSTTFAAHAPLSELAIKDSLYVWTAYRRETTIPQLTVP